MPCVSGSGTTAYEHMKSTKKAYAKINLYLDVMAKREDGYHDIKSVMLQVGLYDEVTVERDGGVDIRLLDLCGELPDGEENIAYRCADAFLRYYDLREGVTIRLKKRIPIAAGLGGGSSNAASALLALRTLYAPALSDEKLECMAAWLGSDVPFFIRGGTMHCTGRGERIAPLPPLTAGWFVIVKPPEGFSTPAMYRRLDELPPEPARPDGMTAALESGDIRAVAAALYNSFERAVPPDSAVRAIEDALRVHGALAAMLSGSGSAVFGLFDREDTAHAAAGALREHWSLTFVARPV